MSDAPSLRRGLAAWLPPLLLLGYAALAFGVWLDSGWRPEWDSATYLLTAAALAEGEGYRYLGEPFFLRPPGFAWLLSHFYSDGFDLPAILSALMACAVGSVALCYVMLRRHTGRAGAVLVALLVGTSGVFLLRLNWVQSEFPFTLAFFGGLACLDAALQRCDADRDDLAWWLAGGVLVGASAWLRSAGLVAVPALVLVALVKNSGRRRRGALLAAGIALAVAAPWLLESRARAGAAQPPSEQLLVFDYATALLHTDPGDPASPLIGVSGVARRIARHASAGAADLTQSVLGTPAASAQGLFAAAWLAGLVLALRRGLGIHEAVALGSLAMLLSYFDYDARLLLPLLPYAYFYPVLLGRRALSLPRGAPRVFARSACGLVLALVCAVNAATLPAALAVEAHPTPLGSQGAVWAHWQRSAAWLQEHTAEDDAILARAAPILSLLSKRRVYTYRFARSPGLVARTGARWVVFDGAPPPDVVAAARAGRDASVPGVRPGTHTRIAELR